MSVSGTYYARGWDHLGAIGAKLRDLGGAGALAYELIQNADDAGAVEITFRIERDALIVDNDGVFSDCGDVGAIECPWRTDGEHGHRCDFHRFRLVASGDKRFEIGVTGAFGVGFISVYQVTDHPELISAGRHWIIDESRPEAKRIRECGGCARCLARSLPGTRLFLPWASNPESVLRLAFQAEAVDAKRIDGLEDELSDVLSDALLFLRHLNWAELWTESRRIQRSERRPDVRAVVVADKTGTHNWSVFEGDFDSAANGFRETYGSLIEDKRSSRVKIAIPDDRGILGRLFAFLPTQHTTGLPFHIQADFFPTSDRKQVVLDSSYQAEWNTAALTAAAQTLATSLDELRTSLPPRNFWDLVEAVHHVSVEADKGERESVLSEMWRAAHPVLRALPSIWTGSKQWCTPSESRLLEKPDEEGSLPVLLDLGIEIVHPTLRPYFGLLRSNEVGVPLLDVEDIAQALTAIPEASARPQVWPPALRSPNSVAQLWHEIEILLARPRRADDLAEAMDALAECRIVPCRDGTPRTILEAYWTDDETVNLFATVMPSIPFGHAAGDLAGTLARYCRPFDAGAAVDALTDVCESGNGELPIALDDAVKILRWFEERRDQLRSAPDLREALAELPLFPSGGRLRPLRSVSLPGDFVDPLGLAEVVDVERLGGRREFLVQLGARELGIAQYVSVHVSAALADPEVSSDKRRRVVRLLAERLGEFRDDPQAQAALAATECVECEDGAFRRPDTTYAPTGTARSLLGSAGLYASVPQERRAAVEGLLQWLGVASEPRIDDLISLVATETELVPDTDRVGKIGKILLHLTTRWERGGLSPDELQDLAHRAWLPVKGDLVSWHRPGAIYTTFRDYLFSTQALFINLPAQIQRDTAPFLEQLGVQTNPTAVQVVSHLLSCCSVGRSVKTEVYAYLEDDLGSPQTQAALSRLEGKACLLIHGDRYVAPGLAFWSDHPFGHWRYVLGPELRRFQRLLSILGVRERPQPSDALAVVSELANEYGQGNKTLDSEARTVAFRCWAELSLALEHGEVAADELLNLSESKVIPGPQGILERPAWLFFADRAGFSERFPKLRPNIISRPEGASRAMQVAGVRPLASAAVPEVVECLDPQDDPDLPERFLDRRSQLTRVLEAVSQDNLPSVTLDAALSKMRCVSVTGLRIRYRIAAFGRDAVSEPESTAALYDRSGNVLYVKGRGQTMPWPSVAREIALALCENEVLVGSIAAGIRDVLAADSANAAERALDELGFPPMDATVAGATPSDGAVVHDLGVMDGEGGGLDTSPRDGSATSAARPGSEPPGQAPRPSGQTEEHLELAGQSGPGGAREASIGADEGRTRSPNRPQGRFFTYVVPSNRVEPENSGQATIGGADSDEEVDRAGIKLVVAFEELQGRHAMVMPHSHPGYDIESCDRNGAIVRYIEVKSSTDTWGTRGVALSDKQFERAQELGQRFWLYVVERALQPNALIYRIQNPGNMVNQYVYDAGWRGLAE